MFGNYSDEALQNIIDNPRDSGRGPVRAAPYLLTIPVEKRMDAVSEAGTLQNLMGGIFSDRIREVCNTIRDNIANGEPDRELYGQRTAREYREREADLRRITGDSSTIYYPKSM